MAAWSASATATPSVNWQQSGTGIPCRLAKAAQAAFFRAIGDVSRCQPGQRHRFCLDSVYHAVDDPPLHESPTVNQPSPAIVAQEGVRRLPRWGLLLFCAVYVLFGFLWRDPWRRADISSFGIMLELAQNPSHWLAPTLLGQAADTNALLHYWLGAAAIQLLPLEPFVAVRVLFVLMLWLTLAATWYGIYYLARGPSARPVSFAFGGEAHPTDYARTLADGGLLALTACLGLAQPSHEVAAPLTQLCCASFMLYAFAALPYRTVLPALFGTLGTLGLALAGAPSMALLFSLAATLIYAGSRSEWNRLVEADGYETDPVLLQAHARRRWLWVAALALLTLLVALLASQLDLWRWHLQPLPSRWVEWRDLIKLHIWFTWPVWPLALWTIWRWRTHWRRGRAAFSITLPLVAGLICSIAGWIGDSPKDSLLLGLPAYAALAAFALPTFKRSAQAFIDWFSLIVFTAAATAMWLIWIAMQAGWQLRVVERVLAAVPGYVPVFNWGLFLSALVATLGWLYLVRWRTKRLRPALWKSMILPAGGVTLCWVLMMTIWLPAINHARSYTVVAEGISQTMHSADPAAPCLEIIGLDEAQTSALLYHTPFEIRRAGTSLQCRWLATDESQVMLLPHLHDMQPWREAAVIYRPGRSEAIHLYHRLP